MRAGIAIALIWTGCVEAQPFVCSSDDACGASGLCEPEGYCSFADDTCHMGRRFGEYAPAELANTCVGPAVGAIAEIRAGGEHTCVRAESGALWCWGGNSYGALGNGGWVDAPAPLPLPVTTTSTADIANMEGRALAAVTVAAGVWHSCAVERGGALWCWGNGESGQLGDGILASQASPVRVNGVSNAARVAVGERHSCVLTESHQVLCWGDGSAGQLGTGLAESHALPALVALDGVVELQAGRAHTCARDTSERVWCWGNNRSGQLGLGDRESRHEPVEVPAFAGALALALGAEHTCALLSGGRVRCAGENQDGQLGDDGQNDRSSPVDVRGLGHVVEIAAGGAFTCALARNGSVRCWGRGESGELGHGAAQGKRRPDKPVKLKLGAVAITAGARHACAQDGDGCVWCWGANELGQLGHGNEADSSEPVPVRLSCGPDSSE